MNLRRGLVSVCWLVTLIGDHVQGFRPGPSFGVAMSTGNVASQVISIDGASRLVRGRLGVALSCAIFQGAGILLLLSWYGLL